jgi:hypothetical protein
MDFSTTMHRRFACVSQARRMYNDDYSSTTYRVDAEEGKSLLPPQSPLHELGLGRLGMTFLVNRLIVNLPLTITLTTC